MNAHQQSLSLLAVAWLCGLGRSVGEQGLPFDLDANVAKSANIVMGTLHHDGTLHGTRAFKGELLASKTYPIANGDHSFNEFSKALGEGDNLEVVAFLRKPSSDNYYRFATGNIGMVALSNSDKVFASLPSFSPEGLSIQALRNWTKATFLAEIGPSLARSRKFDLLLSKPLSNDRVNTLLGFLREEVKWSIMNGEDLRTALPYSLRGYFFLEVMVRLQKPSKSEESAIGALLHQAVSDEERAMLLAIITYTHCSKALYASVLPYVDPKNSGPVRREAFAALASIDSYSAASVLSRFLSLEEPELDSVLSILYSYSWREKSRGLNIEVIQPLLNFSLNALEKYRTSNKAPEINNRCLAVWGLIDRYFHPALLPIPIKWTNEKDPISSAKAATLLRSLFGYTGPPEQLNIWWEKYRKEIQRSHELSTTQGVREWLQALNQCEDVWTKQLLLRLWRFQPSIPETFLLEECRGKASVPTKELLSELWQRKRLSAEARKSLVKDYMIMKVSVTPVLQTDHLKCHELTFSGDRQFPFPEAARVNLTGRLASNTEPQISAPKSSLTFGLEGSGPIDFLTTTEAGDGSLNAVFELWEADNKTSSPQDLWRLRWDLEPTEKP